ncbi:MAG: amidohydrolase family protein [Planctomycetota bacterium]
MLSLPIFLLADVALVGGTVHSMVPGEEPRIATVLVHGGAIAAVGPDVAVPAGTERIDATGLHIVPGLIDAMVNFDPEHDALYVLAGVTTVRDVGSRRVQNLIERRAEARERTPGPRLLTAGAPLDGDPPGTPEAAVVRDAAAADGILSVVLLDDPDFLHLLRGLPADAYRRILERAGEEELAVWGPVPAALTLAEAVDAGQRGFFYIDQLLPPGASWPLVQPPAFDAAVAKLAGGGCAVVPVLRAATEQLANQNQIPAAVELLALLAPAYEEWWVAEALRRSALLTESVLADGRRGLEKRRALLVRLHEAGVPLVPGSGAPMPWLFPGRSLHLELAEWVAAGIPPAAVLDLATRGAAAALGRAGECGTIAPGLAADLVAVGADPREDLLALLDPTLVVLRGRVLERRDLDDLFDELAGKERAARELLARPLAVADPPRPEGAVVLSGQVESHALRQRTSAERFLVVQLPDDNVAITGRVVFPAAGGPATEMTVEQVLAGGQLERFRVVARQGEQELACEGIRFEESFRLRRLVNGQAVQGTEVARGRIRALDAGSVTLLLVLGQIAVEGEYVDFPVLTLHEMLAGETANWRLAIGPKGDHQVRTHVGRLAFRFDEKGAPLLQRTQVGQGVTETVLLSADAFGGAGFPLPAATAERIAAARAQPAAEAEAPAGGEGGGTESGGG